MFHSGLLILLDMNLRPRLFTLSIQDLKPIQIVSPDVNYHSISVSRSVFCLGVAYKILVYDRKSHQQVAELCGITIPLDIAIRGSNIWALANDRRLFQWDLWDSTDSHEPLKPNNISPAGYEFRATIEDTLGWDRRISILPGKDNGGFIIENPYQYTIFNADFAQLKTERQRKALERLQADMAGEFIARADLESGRISIHHILTSIPAINSPLTIPDQHDKYGNFIGFAIDNRSIIRFYVNGLVISSISNARPVVDVLFDHTSSSRMIRLSQLDRPERQLEF